MDERILMEKIAGGDEAALHALLRQYGPLIRYVLRPILTDERDREECYADISLKIWQTAGSFDGEKGTLKAWLTVLSRNAALNRARRAQTDAPLEETFPTPAAAPRRSCCAVSGSSGYRPLSRVCCRRSVACSIENTTTASPPPRWPPSCA